MKDTRSGSLFDDDGGDRPGAMGCRLEIAATMREALEKAKARGLSPPTFHWQDIYAEEHARNFTVTKLGRLDLLAAIYRECKKTAPKASPCATSPRTNWLRPQHPSARRR